MNKKWFTLIEIMIWMLISSMIIIIWFQALHAIMIWKVKLIESTNIEKESFSFMQKFFEEIKSGGLIDMRNILIEKLFEIQPILQVILKDKLDFETLGQEVIFEVLHIIIVFIIVEVEIENEKKWPEHDV